jgi:hypothetical protein
MCSSNHTRSRSGSSLPIGHPFWQRPSILLGNTRQCIVQVIRILPLHALKADCHLRMRWLSTIIVSTEEVINLLSSLDEMVEEIITRTMQRAAHSVLIVLLIMIGKWRRTVWVYLLNLCSSLHIAVYGPVYIHAVAHLNI